MNTPTVIPPRYWPWPPLVPSWPPPDLLKIEVEPAEFAGERPSETDLQVLRSALAVLKAYPGFRTPTERDRHRLFAAIAYVLGYLRALNLVACEPILDTAVGPEPPKIDLEAAYRDLIDALETTTSGQNLKGKPWRDVVRGIGEVLVKVGTFLISLAS